MPVTSRDDGAEDIEDEEGEHVDNELSLLPMFMLDCAEWISEIRG